MDDELDELLAFRFCEPPSEGLESGTDFDLFL
jgi:hypothetical protein